MNDYLICSNRRTLHRNTRYCLLLVLLFFFPILFLNCEVVVATKDLASSSGDDEATTAAAFNDPTNIHAMIVSSSRYWFNYRHAINALGMYEIYRRNGVPDENIILSTFLKVIPCTKRFRRRFIESDYLMISPPPPFFKSLYLRQ
jgi:hypothetical protein